jgi:exodeoxyribonuclease V alpha subunit
MAPKDNKYRRGYGRGYAQKSFLKNKAAGNSSPPPTDLLERTELSGAIEKIVYSNEENYYTVAQFLPENEKKPVTIVGRMMGVQPGETLCIQGDWKNDTRFGWQFAVKSFSATFPRSEIGIFKFLSSGLIAGIGETYAKRIVKKFGSETLEIIETDIKRLKEVSGIGRKRLAMIEKSWNERKNMRDIMLFAGEHGITRAVAERLYRRYGGVEAINTLKHNPFQVALEVRMIGFKTADRIAEKLGIPKDSPDRAEAGVLHVLKERADDGHTFYPVEELTDEAAALLDVDAEIVVAALGRLREKEAIVTEELPNGTKAVFQASLYISERGVKDTLLRLLPKLNKNVNHKRGAQVLLQFQERFKFSLTDEQQGAILQALDGGILVITGGPGTGKTTLVRAMLYTMQAFGRRVTLAAPTGRAAKRMEEACHYYSSTIHRLLKYSPHRGGFLYDEQTPLPTDVLIIDETSMVDIVLAWHLVKSIKTGTTVVFVGDIDQLPSVGPGNFLRDMIESKVIPTIRLTRIFRQAQRSMIVSNAHRINKGIMPILKPQDENDSQNDRIQDFFFIKRDDPEEAVEAIKTLIRDRIPSKFKYDPIADVQVITPMHNATLGARNLNTVLQDLLNPVKATPGQGETVSSDRAPYRVGDKVMQIRNDYDKEVFNGDVGIVTHVNAQGRTLSVEFDGGVVPYDFSETDQLHLAYAATVHKSQGSEYPAVIIPIHTQHYIMLQRNLLYTAVTRGKGLVCIVGTPKALAMAVKNNLIQARHSALDQWLAADLPANETQQ